MARSFVVSLRAPCCSCCSLPIGTPAGASHRCCGLKPGGTPGLSVGEGPGRRSPRPHRIASSGFWQAGPAKTKPARRRTPRSGNESVALAPPDSRPGGRGGGGGAPRHPATPPPPSLAGREAAPPPPPRPRAAGGGGSARSTAPTSAKGRGGGLLLAVVVELGGVRSPRPVGAACSRECRRGMAPVGVALLGAGTFARDAYAGVLGEVRAEPVVLRLQRSSGSDGSGGAAAAARVRPAPPLPLPPRPEAATAAAILDVTVLDGSCSSRRRPQEEVIPGC